MKLSIEDAKELRLQVDSGVVCGHCFRSDCDREATDHTIMMAPGRGYRVNCCRNEAKRIQEQETLKQQGIHADRVAGLLKVAGIPDRFSETDFKGLKMDLLNGEAISSALSIVNEFSKYEKSGKGLVLLGPKGIGKTHILCATLRRLMNKGVGCRYIYTPELIALMLSRAQDQDSQSLLDMTYRELANERCIFIDDLGVNRDSDATVAVLTRVIDSRYRNKKVTLYASNLGAKDLARVIGERSMSRLIECCDIIEIKGPDRRME